MQQQPKKREILKINGREYDVTGRVIFHYRSAIKLFIKFKREYYRRRGYDHEVDGEINPMRTGSTWDMPELTPTVSQVMFQNFYPHISLENAVNRATHLLNDNLHGRFDMAYILFEWMVTNPETQKDENRGRVLHTYRNGIEVTELAKPLDYNSPSYLDWIKKREKDLSEKFDKANFVIDYPCQRTIYERKQFEIGF